MLCGSALDRPDRDSERVRRLRLGQADQVSQHDTSALTVGQSRQGAPEHQVSRHVAILDLSDQPVTGIQRQRPPLNRQPAHRRPRQVDDRALQVRRRRLLVAQPRPSPPQPQERFLSQLLGHVPVAD